MARARRTRQSRTREIRSLRLADLLQDVPPISIFTGRFGTGKTEVAINYALALTGVADSVRLTDMDVVTPYYRSREMTERLDQKGVEVVSPSELTRDIHLPAISASIWGTLQRADGHTVMDVGGDSQGARAIGQFKALFEGSGYVMYLVVNPYRPFNATVERIAETRDDMEANTRLKVGALVSNPNLIAETTLEIVEQGHLLVERASDQLGLPVAFLCMEERLLADGVEHAYTRPILPLTRHLRPPWEE